MRIPDDEFIKLNERNKWIKEKIARSKGSTFLSAEQKAQSAKAHQDFMVEDLARSGLNEQVFQVTVDPMIAMNRDSTAAYKIHYYDLEGVIMEKMWRIRYKRPPYSEFNRYLQPKAEDLNLAGLYSLYPFIDPMVHQLPGDTLYCCEGEKKSVAFMRALGLPAFAIGGCNMWGKDGKLHPWIPELMKQGNRKNLVIVTDGDLNKLEIGRAYSSYVMKVKEAGFSVSLVDPGGKIDDLVVEWGDNASDEWGKLQPLDVNSLVRPASLFIDDYSLAYKLTKDGTRVVYQHSDTVTKLLQQHPGFPKIWRNTDTNKVMFGDDVTVEGSTEMALANEMQYYFALDKVTARHVLDSMRHLSRLNERSPYLDWVKEQVWDGKPRLERWMIDYWGAADTPLVREVGLKWLITSCARLDKPGTKIDWILIVIGPQGTGKTTMPSIMFRDHNTTLYGQHTDKDMSMLLHSALCVGFDELDSFGKKEASTLKAMITTDKDAFRPPYGRSVEVFPRRFTLYGCGNRQQFLIYDPTGYRRYPIVEISRLLEFDKLIEDVPQLWAEAWHLYRQGGIKFWECETANESAEAHVAPNVLEEQVMGWIRMQINSKTATAVKSGVLYFSMSQLIIGMGIDAREARNPHLSGQIADILLANGAVKGNSYRKEIVPGVTGRHYAIDIRGYND